MSSQTAYLSLQYAYWTCRSHAEVLGEALAELQQRQLQLSDIDHPTQEQMRLLDQFAYRYTRLQDDMGARLMPAILRVLEEDITSMSMLDRLNRLEQLGYLPSAEEWADLRRIRNEFTHDYPERLAERFARLQLAWSAAERVLQLFSMLAERVEKLYPELVQEG